MNRAAIRVAAPAAMVMSEARAGRNQAADDDVFLQAAQVVLRGRGPQPR